MSLARPRPSDLFHCEITMKARGLEFWGEGEGSGLSLAMLSMGT